MWFWYFGNIPRIFMPQFYTLATTIYDNLEKHFTFCRHSVKALQALKKEKKKKRKSSVYH